MAKTEEPDSSGVTQEVLSATAETALDVLSRSPDDGIQLVDAWVKTNNAAAVQEIAERGEGKARKAARRGLNVLKSRGVVIPPRRKLAQASETIKLEASMLPPDGAGISLFVIQKTHPGGRCEACFAYLSDQRGVYRVERVDSTANKVKAALNKNMPGANAPSLAVKPVTVPLDWARHRIADARKLHETNKTPEPLGFDSCKDLLEPLVDGELEHPFDAEGFELADDDAKDLANDSGALHHIAEFATWMPPNSALTELMRSLGERLAAQTPEGEQPEQSAVSEHLKEAMLEATDRYFSDEVRAALVRRMKDAALVVLTHRGEAEALKIAATIQVINNCGLITNPPRDVPFLRAFFEKAVSLMMMQQGGQLQIPIPQKPPQPSESAPA